MSDAAIMSLASAAVTITTMVVGFLSLWVKMKYNNQKAEEAVNTAEYTAQVVGDKIDDNTKITKQVIDISKEAKEAASNIKEHTSICTEEINRLARVSAENQNRITILESQITTLKQSVEGVAKSVDSTRHEMRGHLQTITNSLAVITATGRIAVKEEGK